MTIGIVVVCTNAYFILGIRFVKQFMHHYKGDHAIHFYLFTDTDPVPYLPTIKNVHFVETKHTCWTDATNSKFSNILQLKDEPCDYIYYFDADTSISTSFTEEWFLGDLVGGEHYNNGYLDKDGKLEAKPYDRNPLSKAYIPLDTPLPQMYYYGAFFGGRLTNVLDFCTKLVENQQIDRAIPYEPVWNDESYINNYFHYNPPTFVVRNNKFKFNVSDKGGLGNVRNSALDVEIAKRTILQDADEMFTLHNGKVNIVFVKPRVSVVLEYKTLKLSEIKTIVLHNRTDHRKNHVNTVLGNTSLDYRLFDCIIEPHRLVSGIKSLIHIYSELLQRPVFEPVLMLEDDAMTTDAFTDSIEIPTNADCVYLGLSTCCAGPGYLPSTPWIDIQNDKLVKITDMLSMHAYLITSEEWLRVLMNCMTEALTNVTYWDAPVARKMNDYNVYGFKQPFFYQYGPVGGQEGPTKITFDDIRDRVMW